MKTTAISLLAIGLLLLLPGELAAQAADELADLPDEIVWGKFDQTKRSNAFTKALKYIQELVSRHPKDAKYLYCRAETLLALNRYREAERAFDDVLEIESNYLEAYIGQAIIYARENKPEPAKRKMLDAARKGYPVREMQKIPELRDRYLAKDVRFFLKMVESDLPRVDPTRDPFKIPLRREVEDNGTPVAPGPEPVSGDPEPIQRDKCQKMKELLLLVQQHLIAGEEEQARARYKEFKELYDDVLNGRITIEKYKKEMIEAWNTAQRSVYPQLREIELRKFTEEIREGLDKLYEDYKRKDVESAKVHNEELIKMLKPKLESNDPEFVKIAKEFDNVRAGRFEQIRIIEDFQKSVKPYIRLTATIVSPKTSKREAVKIAMVETSFGGEVKKSSLKEGEPLPRLNDFVIDTVEEDLVLAKYKGEKVEVPLGSDFASAGPPKGP